MILSANRAKRGSGSLGFRKTGLTDVTTPGMSRLQGKVGGRVRGPWGPHPAAPNPMPRGARALVPEHQGNAKTPVDRGRFPLEVHIAE